MNDNKIETTDTISFHNLHTVRFPRHCGDVTDDQKVNDVHEIEKQENHANDNNCGDINHDISVLYANDAKNNLKSSKNNRNNIFSISFAEATKSKSVPVVKMGKTSKKRQRSHSAHCHNISLTNKLYSNYVHKTLSWLNFLGNSDTKPNKLKKSRRKSRRDIATSNPLLQKECHNPPLNKNKQYKASKTNDCNVKIIYKNEHQPDEAINTVADTYKYAKKPTKLKKRSTNPKHIKTGNNEFHTANVSKNCVETYNRNEHKSYGTKTKQDRHQGKITERAKKYSNHKNVKSNFKEFTSELKEYFGFDQIGNCVSFQENLHPFNSENNLNKMKKQKIIKRRVRKPYRSNNKLRSYQSTPFGNENVVEFSRQETKTPSLHNCRLPRTTRTKKRSNFNGAASILSIHGCRAISNTEFCESQSLLYSYQKCPNVKKSYHNDVPKYSRNKRNVKKPRHKKNIPSIEYKPLDKAIDHRKEDKVVDYYKVQYKGSSPKINIIKTWSNFLERGRSFGKATVDITSQIQNKNNIKKKHRRVDKSKKNKDCSDSVIFNSVEDPRYDPNIPMHRRFAKLLFDINSPKCETCSYAFNRNPLLTDLFSFPITKKRTSKKEIIKKMCMCTASTLLLLPYWICFFVCRCLKCTPL